MGFSPSQLQSSATCSSFSTLGLKVGCGRQNGTKQTGTTHRSIAYGSEPVTWRLGISWRSNTPSHPGRKLKPFSGSNTSNMQALLSSMVPAIKPLAASLTPNQDEIKLAQCLKHAARKLYGTQWSCTYGQSTWATINVGYVGMLL